MSVLTERARRKILAWKTTRLAYLGDGNGNIFVPGTLGNRAYVRFAAGADANGDAAYTSAVTANWKFGAQISPYEGAGVRVGYDAYGELTIMEADSRDAPLAGLSAQAVNQLNPLTRFVYPEQIAIGRVFAYGTANVSSTYIGWTTLIYDDLAGNLRILNGPSGPTGGLNLASFIPIAGEHRVVVIWLDTYTGLVSATASTAQDMIIPLDFTDFQECDASRPADSIPLGSFLLADAQTNITVTSLYHDIRQLLARPNRVGNPQLISNNQRVWPDMQAVYSGSFTINSGGSLEVLGEAVVM